MEQTQANPKPRLKRRSTGSKRDHLRTRCQCSTLGAGEYQTTQTSRSLNLKTVSKTSPHAFHDPRPEPSIPNWLTAVRSAESKKAENIKVLDLREATSFTDFFVVCSAGNPRQSQAICSAIEKELKETGELPFSVEGYDPAEWILMDYGDFLIHIFSESARSYYDLERLWRHAKLVNTSAESTFSGIHELPGSSAAITG